MLEQSNMYSIIINVVHYIPCRSNQWPWHVIQTENRLCFLQQLNMYCVDKYNLLSCLKKQSLDMTCHSKQILVIVSSPIKYVRCYYKCCRLGLLGKICNALEMVISFVIRATLRARRTRTIQVAMRNQLKHVSSKNIESTLLWLNLTICLFSYASFIGSIITVKIWSIKMLI